MRPYATIIALLGLWIGLTGCSKEESSSTPPSGSSAAPSTQPADGQSTALVTPEVGVKAMTRDQWVPKVGKQGGRLVRDTLGEPKSFNPVVSAETSTSDYTARMFQGLTDLDPFTGEVIPLLAEKWETAADGVTWTFHLRKDVKFNDGTPFTAHDVEFTWNMLTYDLARPEGTEPRWPCSMRDIATFDGKIVQVKALDDYTVQFVTPAKIAIFDQMVADVILSKRKYEPMVKDGSFGGAMGADSKASDIVGTGPFILGEYLRGQRVTLKRNPNYWKKDADGNALPYLEEQVFQITRDMNTMLLNFEQGITDIFGVPSGKEVARLKPTQQSGNFTLYQFGPDDGTVFLCVNMNADAAKAGKFPEYKLKWFRDTRFRQALSYAIDRGAQIRNVRRNLGYPQYAPFTLSPGPFLMEGFAPYEFNPEKAKALLADMGMKPGPDGKLVDADGNKVAFTINTNSGNNIREESANFIRKDLETIGIEVNMLFLEFNLLIDKLDETFDWEVMVMGLTGGREPHWGANIWLSDSRLHMWWPFQKTPGFEWEADIDKIFSEGIQELDKVKRKAIYRRWVEIVHREQPMIYLTVAERVAALRNRFGNIFPSPVGGLLHNEEQIYVISDK